MQMTPQCPRLVPVQRPYPAKIGDRRLMEGVAERER